MKYITIALLAAIFFGVISNLISNKKENQSIMNSKHVVNQVDADKTAIEQLISTLFNEVDNRNWDVVQSTMADSVYTDYSALGGTPGFQSSEAIITGWKSLLPGFERTIHQVHNMAVWVAGDRASATMDAIATHYLAAENDEDYWTVFVGYDTEFIKENGTWKLARIDLSLYDQVGNQNLPAQALNNVQENNIPTLQNSSVAVKSVERFFQSLETRDLNALLNTMAEDVIQEMPLSPKNFPKRLIGKQALEKQYQGVMEYQQKYERTYLPTLNPNVVLVKFRGNVVTEAGKDYNNYYVSIFEVDEEGKITRNVEQFNPNILLSSWTGLQPTNYSVHAAGARRDGGVQLEKVTFPSKGINLGGHLFLPPNFNSNTTYPTVIVTGSWTSVKEQMPDEYASLMAQSGFIALTFDFTGFGESEGQPRQVEDYQLKIADIKAATDFLSRHPNVAQEKLSGLGVCASSGYMAHATAQDDRIKNLVLVAPWLHDPSIAKSIYDFRPGGTEGLLAAAKKAKEQYAATGEMAYVLAASELDPLSAMYVPENAFDYYLNPAKAAGAHYDNRFAVSSWEPWLTFDGISIAQEINQPVFIVHSESGAVPQGAKAFYEQLKGEKEIVWLNAFNQQQLYYEEDAVQAAMEQVIKYLQ
ncbi:MAG: nuclear transport factor 2 family protein [Bacteroidota bacterium]